MSEYPAVVKSARSGRRGWRLSVVLIVVATVAVGVGVAGRSHQDTTPTRSSTVRLMSVQSGCDDWVATADSVPDGWCSGMASWMGNRMRGPMMGTTRWADPDELRASCRQWVAENPDRSGRSTVPTCDYMVRWMRGHAAGKWGVWAMHSR